jgi:hypothetical protein
LERGSIPRGSTTIHMKKNGLLLAAVFSFHIHACTGYIIGFKGLEDAFDTAAFRQYADRLGYCNKVYSWHEDKKAVQYVDQLKVPYQLYGFSKGAQTVSTILGRVKHRPEFVITIGAYKTTNVDFTNYKVNFVNYFDESGKGQKGPGIFLNVLHFEMQKEVNRINGGLSGLGPARS